MKTEQDAHSLHDIESRFTKLFIGRGPFSGRKGSMRDVYEELFLRSSAGYSYIDELLQSGENAVQFLGDQIHFPDLRLLPGNEPLQMRADIVPGKFEGLLDLSFSIQTPKLFQNGMFSEYTVAGKTLGSLIGDRIALWKARFTPTENGTAVIGATQRNIGPEQHAIREYQKNFYSTYRRVVRGFSLWEQFKSYYHHHLELQDHHDYEHYLNRSNVYLFLGIPGNYIINSMEDRYRMNASQLFSLWSIAALQKEGFSDLRLVSNFSQSYFKKHDYTIDATVDYDELGGKYFSFDQRHAEDPFPWHLIHAGPQLGVNQGQAGMSPKFVEYMTSGHLEIHKSSMGS